MNEIDDQDELVPEKDALPGGIAVAAIIIAGIAALLSVGAVLVLVPTSPLSGIFSDMVVVVTDDFLAFLCIASVAIVMFSTAISKGYRRKLLIGWLFIAIQMCCWLYLYPTLRFLETGILSSTPWF